MPIPTPEERANGVFICAHDADTRRNIAAAILLDRRAVLAPNEEAIEAVAIAIHEVPDFPAKTYLRRCGSAALAALRRLYGVE